VQLLYIAIANEGLLFFDLYQELTCTLSRSIFLCCTVSLKSIHLHNDLLHGGFLVSANLVVEESTRQNEQVDQVLGRGLLAPRLDSQTLDHLLLVNEAESSLV
jgi:hypothetical protein